MATRTGSAGSVWPTANGKKTDYETWLQQLVSALANLKDTRPADQPFVITETFFPTARIFIFDDLGGDDEVDKFESDRQSLSPLDDADSIQRKIALIRTSSDGPLCRAQSWHSADAVPT